MNFFGGICKHTKNIQGNVILFRNLALKVTYMGVPYNDLHLYLYLLDNEKDVLAFVRHVVQENA